MDRISTKIRKRIIRDFSMPQRTSTNSGVLTLLFILVTLLWVIPQADAHDWKGKIKHVRSGESIQNAINGAHYGERIFVEAGTYAEQLTIKSDGIALIGYGAILVPPKDWKQNTCSGLSGDGTQAGICVTGSGVKLAPFKQEHRKVISVRRPVKDVYVTGFEVRGFSGQNIAFVGTRDCEATRNKLINGDTYGFLTAGSKGTQAHGNTVISEKTLRFIAMCMDDLADAHFSDNNVSGYYVGLCVQTPGADISKNCVSQSCNGIFVDPGVRGAQVWYNRVTSWNPACGKEGPFAGIFIDAAINTKVEHNFVEGQKNGDSVVGIAIYDDPTTSPVSVASGNMVEQNILCNNDVDIVIKSAGKGNVAEHNICSTSDPEGLCAWK